LRTDRGSDKGDFIMSSILETIMLVCFGFSWPMNVVKNIKSKTARSMSLPFIMLIISGYIAGITAKIVTHQLNYVLAVYIINLAIVSVNIVVYFINKRHDKDTENAVTA
jgi:glucan phosphoethanolaminetransferase (alkaline phosphatase superfamily)